MWSYTPPLKDMRFVIDELLNVRADWADMPPFADLELDTVAQILQEGGDFAEHTLLPINAAGDLQGCRYENGDVKTPAGFAQAYRDYCAAGWPSLACDPQSGGQGLPQLLNAGLYEMLNSTNHAWTMYPGLAFGTYECLRAYASDDLKALYLPRIVSGECLGTMCLTEPQAGSDVGLIRTRAEPTGDGAYLISGSKIFISGGDHDLTENIIHLVLARLPGAPAGIRGISLFLSPKYVPSGNDLARNSIRCDGIEKKMGIKASATCVIRFEEARGWLVGDPNAGLAAMFVMMNVARLHVALQGLGHAEMAYQNAIRYSEERVQMRVPAKPLNLPLPAPVTADKIALHPAIRRTLLRVRAMVEGGRALAYWTAHLIDVSEHHANRSHRGAARDLAALLTPVVKSFLTENGFESASAALQVWGGYGYIHDYGVEQSVRDSRIAMIYEGTNEIQANDLLMRKVVADHGKALRLMLTLIGEEAQLCSDTPGCESFASALSALLASISAVAEAIIGDVGREPETGYRVAGEFLRLTGLLLLGHFWARSARLAIGRIADDFYRQKLDTANYYFDYVLPEAVMCLAVIERRHRSLPLL